MRTESESQGSMRCGDGTCEVEGEQGTPRRSEVDDKEGCSVHSEEAADDQAPIESTQPSEPASEESSAPKGGGVKAGYEGRARRGISKAGGYDETPTGSVSQKVQGMDVFFSK